MIGLTPSPQRTLSTIRHFHDEQGRVPSFRELADLLGVASTSGVHEAVLALVERGHLTKELHRGRVRYRLVHEPIPADPLANGWRFISIDELEQGRCAA